MDMVNRLHLLKKEASCYHELIPLQARSHSCQSCVPCQATVESKYRATSNWPDNANWPEERSDRNAIHRV